MTQVGDLRYFSYDLHVHSSDGTEKLTRRIKIFPYFKTAGEAEDELLIAAEKWHDRYYKSIMGLHREFMIRRNYGESGSDLAHIECELQKLHRDYLRSFRGAVLRQSNSLMPCRIVTWCEEIQFPIVGVLLDIWLGRVLLNVRSLPEPIIPPVLPLLDEKWSKPKGSKVKNVIQEKDYDIVPDPHHLIS